MNGDNYSWDINPIVTMPAIFTNPIVSVDFSSAAAGGNVTSDGGATVTARGVCWSTSPNPTVDLPTKTFDGSGTGSFNSNITGLTLGTPYYVRAYATNSEGTAYGNEIYFTTSIGVPSMTTAAITSITQTTATSGGNVSSDGGATVTARGVCWSTSPNPTTAKNKTTDGSGTGSFTSDIAGLSPGTPYYLRAYATNSQGTGYGNQVSFTTLAGTPTLTTAAVSSIGQTAATSGGNVSSDGGCSSNGPGCLLEHLVQPDHGQQQDDRWYRNWEFCQFAYRPESGHPVLRASVCEQ